MKVAIVFAALVAVACAGVITDDQVQVLKYDNVNEGNHQYTYSVETSDGQTRSESGHVNHVGTDNEALEVTGQYQYTGPDGQTYSVRYVANENGFQPEAAHLPVAPTV